MTERPITQTQLNALEQAVDKVFGKIGIDVEFTRHFLDRVNDERNQKQITLRELGLLFAKEYKRWGRAISQMPIDSQAVMKDLSSEINIPFVLNPDGKEKDLVAKTVMRKKNFTTPDKTLPVESVNETVVQEGKLSDVIPQLEKELNAAGGYDRKVFELEMGKRSRAPGTWGFGSAGGGIMIRWMTYGAKSLAEERGVDVKEVIKEARGVIKKWLQANTKPITVRDRDSRETKQFYVKGQLAFDDNIHYVRVNTKRMLQNKSRFEIQEDDDTVAVADLGKTKKQGSERERWDAKMKRREKLRKKPAFQPGNLLGRPVKEEKYGAKKGSQVKGHEPTPSKRKPTKGGETPHPMRGRLVGEGLGDNFISAKTFAEIMALKTDAELAKNYQEYVVDGGKGKSLHPRKLKQVQDAIKNELEMRGRVVGEGMDQPPLDVETPSPAVIAQRHGVPLKQIEAQLRIGLDIEMEHTESPFAAMEIALDHLAEMPDYYSRLVDMENEGGYSVDSVREEWDSYKIDERILAPEVAILRKALRYLDAMVKSRGSRQTIEGYAFDIVRSFNLDSIASPRELAQMYQEWKNSDMLPESD